MERRLSAIMSADVAGYSRLMEKDESGTLEALKSLREELINPEIKKHRGRIVKLIGDGLLVEFSSVVDAINSAIAIQKNVELHNNDIPPDKVIAFRIGVHLGDIIVEEDDIYGDGVNIAARLEALADAGGICLSQQAYDQIETKINANFQDLGEQNVKNIERKIHVFRILKEGEQSKQRKQKFSNLPNSRIFVASILFLLIGITTIGYLWKPWSETKRPNTQGLADSSETKRSEKTSIAVLNFRNLSNDPQQEYFAVGMAEDLVTGLSKLSALSVIARDLSFRYKGQDSNIKQIGQALDAKYLVQGSVRKAGDQVRINAVLIDSESGQQIWAERYDGKFENTFALQDKITERILRALSIELSPDERVKLADHGTKNIEAHDAFLRGQSYARQYTAYGNKLAVEQFRRALELDPNYDRASDSLKNTLLISEKSGLQ